MAELVGISEKIKDLKFQLDRDRTTIGRTGDNGITLDDPTVSANHCYIAQRGGRFVIHDLNSTNGTMVDHERITECELEDGQIVNIGALEFNFICEDGEGGNAGNKVEKTQIIPLNRSPKPPKSFTSVSPFGAKRKKSKGLAVFLLVAVGILALAGVAWLVINLLALGK